ncbi:MAG: PTS glucose transporter subunit IIA [Eubacteriales bacterium]|nr:PTS glucose transporter subunit IIA [Eubacteriales bacterium]
MFDFLKKKKKQEIHAPFAGKITGITEVPDPVFSQKMVGDGFAVTPAGQIVEALAPISGELSVLFPTGHAYGIKTEDGFEVLVHLGLDTVELNGDGFECLKEQGQQVSAGEPVVRMDIEKIEAAGKATITPVVFTNKEMVKEIEILKTDCEAADIVAKVECK